MNEVDKILKLKIRLYVTAASAFCRHVKRFSELGITKGYEDGTFRPGLIVNRASMAAFVARAFFHMP